MLIKANRSKQRHTRQLFLKISGNSLPISSNSFALPITGNPLSVNKTIHETAIPDINVVTKRNETKRNFQKYLDGWCVGIWSVNETHAISSVAKPFGMMKRPKNRRVTQVPCPCFVTHSSSASVQHVHPAYRHMRSRWSRRRRRCECAAYPDPCPSLFDKGDKTSRAFTVLFRKCTNTRGRKSRDAVTRAQWDETELRDTAEGAVSARKVEESPRKTIGRASRFSSLARPSFSSLRHCRATHAIFLLRTHIPLAFTQRACVCVRVYERSKRFVVWVSKRGCIGAYVRGRFSSLSFPTHTATGYSHITADTWRAMFIEGRKIDGAGRREATHGNPSSF